MYGAQTWATINKQFQKIQKTQNAMLPSILQVRLKDKVSNELILNKTRPKVAEVIARTLKYKYMGHVVREQSHKWNKILTFWIPHTGRGDLGEGQQRGG